MCNLTGALMFRSSWCFIACGKQSEIVLFLGGFLSLLLHIEKRQAPGSPSQWPSWCFLWNLLDCFWFTVSVRVKFGHVSLSRMKHHTKLVSAVAYCQTWISWPHTSILIFPPGGLKKSDHFCVCLSLWHFIMYRANDSRDVQKSDIQRSIGYWLLMETTVYVQDDVQ